MLTYINMPTKKYPGTIGKPFIMRFDRDWLKRFDIIKASYDQKFLVIKVYKDTRWKRFLRRLGFRTRICQAKVIQYDS